MNCGLNRGCNNVTDCVADLDCCPHSPISPTCFTKYCHPGQAANVFGTCQELNPQISCNNGERSETETDVDRGGTQCLVVGNAWRRRLGVQQHSRLQQRARLLRQRLLLVQQHTLTDVDETDVDCGGNTSLPGLASAWWKLLLLNAASLSFGLSLGIAMISLLGSIDYNKIINEQNCPERPALHRRRRLLEPRQLQQVQRLRDLPRRRRLRQLEMPS